MLLGTAGLSALALAALVLTLVRTPADRLRAGTRAVVRVASVAILVQAVHFGEELVTRFYQRFPATLGLESWPPGFFVAFNVAWLAIWILSAAALRTGHRAAFFPLWFLAVASMANGAAHPLLAVRAGGYFPGLLTSPVAGVAGLVLFQRLLAITEGAGKATIPAS